MARALGTRDEFASGAEWLEIVGFPLVGLLIASLCVFGFCVCGLAVPSGDEHGSGGFFFLFDRLERGRESCYQATKALCWLPLFPTKLLAVRVKR